MLALPGRGSVEVVTGSAEDMSTSEVVSAEAAGCVDSGSKEPSPPPPEGSVCGTTRRATDWTAEGESWKSEVAGSGEKSGRPAPGVAVVAGAGVGAGAGVAAS